MQNPPSWNSDDDQANKIDRERDYEAVEGCEQPEQKSPAQGVAQASFAGRNDYADPHSYGRHSSCGACGKDVCNDERTKPIRHRLDHILATTLFRGLGPMLSGTQPFQQLNEPEPPVALARVEADLRRAGIGVVVVVPGLAHGGDGGPGDVMGLDARLAHQPGLRTATVGQMADEPVADDAGRDPGADAPDHETPAAHQPQRRRDRKLLQHPGPSQEPIEGIAADPAQLELGRPFQHQPAVHLPPGVDRHRPPVRQIVVTVGLALGPVADVVGADHPEGAAHADQGPEPGQDALQPQRAIEAAVDQPTVKSDRMAQQKRRPCHDDEDCDSGEAEGLGAEDQGGGQHGAVPQRVTRVPDDTAFDRAAAGRLDETVHGAGISVVHVGLPS
ncbi:hypothetical protein LTR94_016398 [Friedmanniomyces endolithicus]|nr:hypothetical protein LTR94_016398 [Friedmanniomyces endolithicus]